MRPKLFVGTVALVLLTSACQISIDVSAVMRDGGDGTFRIVFAFDKAFVDAMGSTEEGAESLAQLRSAASSFSGTGWRVKTEEPEGGLRITIVRDFADPDELHEAIRTVADKQEEGRLAFLNIFRDFTLSHSSGLTKTTSGVKGRVDLAPERLAPGFANAEDNLKKALEDAARRVFTFRVGVALPGSVTSFEGDPTRVGGGSVEWAVPFGETLAFEATAESTKAMGVMLVASPAVLAIAAIVVWLLMRRRRRAAPVEGWEVAEATAPAESDRA